MEIRRFTPSDRKYLRDICIKTAIGYETMGKKKQKAICSFYIDYYTECEPDNVFTACEDGKPIGYIIASNDGKKYSKEIVNYLRRAGGYSIELAGMYTLLLLLEKLLFADNSAHIHINILDGYRRKGIGTALLKTELENLSAKGINKIHLIAGSNNIRALMFYEKNGFELYKDIFGASVYVKNT